MTFSQVTLQHRQGSLVSHLVSEEIDVRRLEAFTQVHTLAEPNEGSAAIVESLKARIP